jgi:histone demethylase JARID1
VARRKKAPEQASAEELALTAAAATAKAAYDDAAAVLAEATRPSPARQMFAGLKSALAMELDHDPADPELPVLLREVCGASWRARAEKALAPALALGEKWSEPRSDAADEPDRDAKAAPLPDAAVFPTLGVLTRLRETGVASGMIVPGGGEGEDALGAKVRRLERLGQKWLDRAADAVDKTRDVPVEQVKALMAEGRALPIHLKEELEELGERCEVYCVCETAYDATRPMISCDACEGWFHYECCNMRPPSLDEPEDQDARFTCPPCCAKTGAAYAPFRPPPVETENAQTAAEPDAAEPDAAEPDAAEPDAEAEAEEEAKPAPAEPDAAPAPPSGRGARRRRG